MLKKKFRDGAPVSGPVDIQERGPKHELHRPKAKIRKQEPEPPPDPEVLKPAVPQPSGKSLHKESASYGCCSKQLRTYISMSISHLMYMYM